MWLECIDVVSGCCCKEVYRYPNNKWGEPKRAPHEIGSIYRVARLIYKVRHENSGCWTDGMAHYARHFCIDHCRFYFSSCTCVAACLVRY